MNDVKNFVDLYKNQLVSVVKTGHVAKIAAKMAEILTKIPDELNDSHLNNFTGDIIGDLNREINYFNSYEDEENKTFYRIYIPYEYAQKLDLQKFEHTINDDGEEIFVEISSCTIVLPDPVDSQGNSDFDLDNENNSEASE